MRNIIRPMLMSLLGYFLFLGCHLEADTFSCASLTVGANDFAVQWENPTLTLTVTTDDLLANETAVTSFNDATDKLVATIRVDTNTYDFEIAGLTPGTDDFTGLGGPWETPNNHFRFSNATGDEIACYLDAIQTGNNHPGTTTYSGSDLATVVSASTVCRQVRFNFPVGELFNAIEGTYSCTIQLTGTVP